MIFVLNPTRIRLNFSNREPSRISPVASNPRTETHQMQNFFEARLKTWDELHNAVLCNLLFSLKDNIPRMPIYYPTITLTAANARFCLCTTTTRFLYCVVHCVFGNFHFAHQARSPLLLSQCDISVDGHASVVLLLLTAAIFLHPRCISLQTQVLFFLVCAHFVSCNMSQAPRAKLLAHNKEESDCPRSVLIVEM